MPQSNARVLIHAVFATEDRAPKLLDDWRSEAFTYMGGTLRDIGCRPVEIGGVQDHVHALFELGREITLSDTIKTLKTASTKWIKRQFVEEFGWQKGYGAFSVSNSNVGQVVSYIRNQEEHHKSFSYEDELRSIFAEHGIDWDPRDF